MIRLECNELALLSIAAVKQQKKKRTLNLHTNDGNEVIFDLNEHMKYVNSGGDNFR